MEIVFSVVPWIFIGAFWIFVVWGIWTLIATARGILDQLHRIADQLERRDVGAVGQVDGLE